MMQLPPVGTLQILLVDQKKGAKEGRSIASKVSESHKGTTILDDEVETRREVRLSLVKFSVTII